MDTSPRNIALILFSICRNGAGAMPWDSLSGSSSSSIAGASSRRGVDMISMDQGKLKTCSVHHLYLPLHRPCGKPTRIQYWSWRWRQWWNNRQRCDPRQRQPRIIDHRTSIRRITGFLSKQSRLLRWRQTVCFWYLNIIVFRPKCIVIRRISAVEFEKSKKMFVLIRLY